MTEPTPRPLVRLPFLAVLGSLFFAISPLISVLIASAIAEWAGCTLNEGQAHRCVVCGVNVGRTLNSMYVLGWAALLTLPIGAFLFVGSLIWLIVDTTMGIAQKAGVVSRRVVLDRIDDRPTGPSVSN